MPRLKQTFAALAFAICWTPLIAEAQEPGWTSGVIKRGQDRVNSQNTHILNRPYRPLHFYGNTVRRLHYHGRALPTREHVQKTSQMLRGGPAAPANTQVTQPLGVIAPPAIQSAPRVNVVTVGPGCGPVSPTPTQVTGQGYSGFRVRQSSLPR